MQVIGKERCQLLEKLTRRKIYSEYYNAIIFDKIHVRMLQELTMNLVVNPEQLKKNWSSEKDRLKVLSAYTTLDHRIINRYSTVRSANSQF